MFGVTGGEIGIVTFIFALVWGASILPRLGERVAMALLSRRTELRSAGSGGAAPARARGKGR